MKPFAFAKSQNFRVFAKGNNNKVSSLTDMPSCVPFVFAKGIIGKYCPLGKTKWFSQHDLMIKSHVIKPTCFASTQWHSRSQWLCNYNGTSGLCNYKASQWFSTGSVGVIPCEVITEPCRHLLRLDSWFKYSITKLGKSGSVRTRTSTKLERLTWNRMTHRYF